MQMNSLESGLQKGMIAFLSFSHFFPLPPFIFSLPSTSLHLPPSRTDPGRTAGLKKFGFPTGAIPEESGARGRRGGGSRALTRPALMRGFPGSPARYPENQGPGAFGSPGRQRGEEPRKEGAEGASPAPLRGGVPSAGQGMSPPLTYPVPSVRFDMATFR